MADTIRIKPAPGMLVRNPQRDYRPVEADGEVVVRDEYFIRRLRDGDVVEDRAAPAEAPAAAPAKPAKK